MKYLIIIPLLFISACASLKKTVFNDKEYAQIKPGNGLLAFSLHIFTDINHINIISSNAGQDFNISFPPAGESLYLYEVPAGEYCIQRVQTPRGWTSFKSTTSHDAKGICTLVEDETIAYSGEIYFTGGARVTSNYPNFIKQLKIKFPLVCKHYIGKACE